MAFNFLNINDKTNVMLPGHSGTYDTPPMDLRFLAPFVKPTVTNLGVKMDFDFKLDKQISSVVKSSILFLLGSRGKAFF